jgi:hypothetical protein
VESVPLIQSDTRADRNVLDAENTQNSSLDRALNAQSTSKLETSVNVLYHPRAMTECLEGEPKVRPLEMNAHDVGFD